MWITKAARLLPSPHHAAAAALGDSAEGILNHRVDSSHSGNSSGCKSFFKFRRNNLSTQ